MRELTIYKLGIIDKKGKPFKRSSELESVDEKAIIHDVTSSGIQDS